ncbi:NAD-dependent epimerase/dehydratase family protein [Paenibacillus piri]|uniref:NAD-dependent epimerase/dehydratase family protein n=1 Tax=Paenibacillus piri TaxID=2547395 RepID=A0A4R5KMS5_9BACL|nr:NAD-dependent epimerase/dehydratase family protein [Paenibacillus piri]TDF96208.1 NAD-dependent epimerase/dehydratase family protein [Paenibacillus piri]
MNCIVFGGGGFIGSHICDELLSQDNKVRAFGRTRSNYLSRDVEWYQGDFCKASDVENALDEMEVIFHVISTTIPQTSNESPDKDIESNVISTLRMLEIARIKKIKKVIFISSGGTVYGIPENIPINEKHVTNPISSYGVHKLTIEKYLMLYFYLYGLDYAILRVSNPYGIRQPIIGSQGAIGIFINKALNREVIEIWGDGSVVRDYIYVTDVAKAASLVVNNNSSLKIFNIGSGEGKSLLQIIQYIEKQLDIKLKVNFKNERKLDVPKNILDINLALNILSWKPSISFEEGINKTIDFMKVEMLQK